MVTILIVLYVLLGLGCTALTMYDRRRESYLEVSFLVLTLVFWPVVMLALGLTRLEVPTIRNPFWTRGTP